jgi:hypothetical protein
VSLIDNLHLPNEVLEKLDLNTDDIVLHRQKEKKYFKTKETSYDIASIFMLAMIACYCFEVYDLILFLILFFSWIVSMMIGIHFAKKYGQEQETISRLQLQALRIAEYNARREEFIKHVTEIKARKEEDAKHVT